MARHKPNWELNEAVKAARKTIKADPLPKTGAAFDKLLPKSKTRGGNGAGAPPAPAPH
jgi:hypothetical protein